MAPQIVDMVKQFLNKRNSAISASVSKTVYDSENVEIYDGLNRIALHKRDYRKHVHTTLDIHMPEKHLQYKTRLGWDEKYFLERAVQSVQSFQTVLIANC